MDTVTIEQGGGSTISPYRVLSRYWLVIVVMAFVGAGLTVGFNKVRAPVYTSTSTVAWNPNFRAELPTLFSAPSPNIQPAVDMATAATWVTGDVVMSSASAAVGVAAEDLRDSTTVVPSLSTYTIEITVEAPSAGETRDRTNAVTNSFVQESRRQVLVTLTAQAEQVSAALRLLATVLTPSETADLRNNQALLAATAASTNGPATVVQRATEPVDVRGGIARTAAIGGALGLVLGVLVAFALGARPNSGSRTVRRPLKQSSPPELATVDHPDPGNKQLDD